MTFTNMRFINIHSISTKIIILLVVTSTLFIVFTFSMAKNIFSHGFEKIVYEKMLITQDTIIPQIELNLSYDFTLPIVELGNDLLEDKNILLLKIESKKLHTPLIFTNALKKENISSQYTTYKKLYDPKTKKEIGRLTLMYSTNFYDNYMQDFYGWIIWGIVGFLAFILIISLLLSKALRPLSNLAQEMKQFNPFEPQKFQLKEFKDDEIGSIASAANIMIENLRKYIQHSDELTAELSTKEVHLRDAQRIANVGSWEYNIVEDILILSDEVYRILGTKLSSHLTFNTFLDYITLDDKARVKMILENAIKKGSRFNIKYKLIKQNSKVIHVRTRGKVRKKLTGEIKLTAVTIDITKEIKNKQTIERLAYYDALTNLPNRTLLQDRANIALSKAKRNKSKFAILFLDLDHFKLINDTLGHNVGDELLIHIANQLKNILRQSDSISRIGGDEFIILLSEIKSDEDASIIANKILSTLNTEHQISSNKLHISTSIGIAIYPQNGTNLEELMTKADTAMYDAKKNGRNNYKVYSQVMSEHINNVILVENDLRASIQNQDDFKVYYQPKIDTKTSNVSGVEALLRWEHPTKGLIYPDEFIKIAEDNGAIVSIGKIIIQKVIQDISELNKLSFGELKFAINLSAKQFLDTTLIPFITQLIKEYDVKASQLEFEITETLSMQNIQESLSVMNKIKEIGSSIAIDDFGTGYSSLSYLKQFPINTLKIDKEFVIDMTQDKDDKTIVRTIISMAQALGLRTVAEGVETKEHVTALTLMGCNELQGFHFSKAIPFKEFTAFLQEYNS